MMIHAGEETVILEESSSISPGFNEEYEQLQKNLVFTPSSAVLWFECQICNRKSATEERLQKHIEKKHPNGEAEPPPVIQPIRKDSSSTATSPPPHERFKCLVCPFACSTNADLMRHSKKHTGIKPYHCEICGKSFSQKGNLKPHMLRHSGEMPFKCNQCPRAFNHKTSYRKHLEEHASPKVIPCRFCPKLMFSSTEDRNRHEKSKHFDEDVDCVICGVILSSSVGLRMHVAQMHPEFYQNSNLATEKKWACHICKKKFSTKAYLMVHHKIHTGEKPFKCSQKDCTYTAISKDSIKKHVVRAHGNFKVITCKLCNKTFTHYSHKKAHMLRHYNLKPFKCHLCSRSFFLKRHLSDHIRLHEGDAKYKCEKCDIAYVLPDSLRKHKDLHLSSPLTCHICQKQFWVAGTYNKHMLMHRREFNNNKASLKPYKCEECGKAFKVKRFFTRHVLKGCQATKDDGLHECTECDTVLPSKVAFQKHLKMYHNIREHSCYICAEAFRRLHTLEQHIYDCHPEEAEKDGNELVSFFNSNKRHDSSSAEDIVVVPLIYTDSSSNILVINENDSSSNNMPIKSEACEVTYECFTCHEICNTYIDLITHREAFHYHSADSSSDMPSESSSRDPEIIPGKVLVTGDNIVPEIPSIKLEPLSDGFMETSESVTCVAQDDEEAEVGTQEGFECPDCGAVYSSYSECEAHYLASHSMRDSK